MHSEKGGKNLMKRALASIQEIIYERGPGVIQIKSV